MATSNNKPEKPQAKKRKTVDTSLESQTLQKMQEKAQAFSSKSARWPTQSVGMCQSMVVMETGSI